MDGTPRVLESSLEDRTRDAARAAFRSGVSFAALCADLGRVAIESLERDRLSAIAIGRAMVRSAATVYHVDGDRGQESAAL